MQPLDRVVLILMILAEIRRSAAEFYEATCAFLHVLRSLGGKRLWHYRFHLHTARFAFTCTCCLVPSVYYALHLNMTGNPFS